MNKKIGIVALLLAVVAISVGLFFITKSKEKTADDSPVIAEDLEDTEGNAEEDTSAVIPETIAGTTAADSETTHESETEETPAAPMAENVVFDHQTNGGKERAVITGYAADGEELWTLTTGQYEIAQIDRVEELGIWDDIYCYVENGTVTAISLTNGELVWINEDYRGGGAHGLFAEDRLYVLSYMSGGLTVIDNNGSTIKHIDELAENYYWAYKLEEADDKLAITFEMGNKGEGGTFYFDPDDWTLRAADGTIIADHGDQSSGVSQSGDNGSQSSGDNSQSSDSDTQTSGDTAQYSDPMDALKEVTASTYLVESQYNLSHGPENVLDRDLTTAWVENGKGNGEGESITFTFSSTQTVSGFTIYNGYQKSESLYYKNARPAKFKVSFSDGSTSTYDVEDCMGEQTISFGRIIETDYVKFTIIITHAGSKYQDTAVTELSIY